MRLDRIKLIAEMTRKNWTTIKLSELSGVFKQTISYIRQGKACSEETGQKIVDALGIPLENLLED